MLIDDIIWLPRVIDKLDWKHDISPEEVEETLFSKPKFRKVQKGHKPDEHLYAALGRTEAGRYILVLFIYKKSREALIISARDMDNKERRQYERK